MSKPSPRAVVNRFPKLKALLRPLYYRLKREPVVLQSSLTGQALKECLGTESPTILEIGCNEGDTTRWLCSMFASPRIYCFEPDPRAVRRFRESVGARPGVELIEGAVGADDGMVQFHMSGGQPEGRSAEDWDASGSIRAPKKHLETHPWCHFDRKVEVSLQCLDSWCALNGVTGVDFIWMDVQGAEIDVVHGAPSSLAKTRFLYTEYSNVELYEGQLPLRGLLRELKGFEVLARYPNDVLVANTALVERRERERLRAILGAP